MTRLPTVGDDVNNWGTVLNQLLQVGHNANGSLSGVMPVYNVKDDAYGCKVDGATDDSVGFTAAYTAAGVTGGVLTGFNGGTLIKGNDTLLSNVIIDMQGGVIKLKNGANTDLFSAQTGSINLAAAFNSGSAGTCFNWGMQNGTLDGNKAGQSSGTSYCIRAYSYGYRLTNVNIRNGFTGGILHDWNGGAGLNAPDDATCYWYGVKVHDNNGMGIEWSGPHDSFWVNVDCYSNGTHGVHICPNAPGMQVMNLQTFSNLSTAIPFITEASTGQYTGFQASGSSVVETVVLGSGNQFINGRHYTNSALGSSGIQVGQAAGNTPYAGQLLQSAGVTTAAAVAGCVFTGKINNCTGANGSLWMANDGGANTCILQIDNSLGGTYMQGNRASSTMFFINGTGATADNTFPKSGGFLVGNAGIANGGLRLNKSATVQTLTNGNTINVVGVGMPRVTSAGAVTGIILQAGVADGQVCCVTNEGANSMTFDVVGTSHVSGGAGVSIAGGTKLFLIYDSTTSLWY